VHPCNVRKWIRRFNRYGIDGIVEMKPAGRKAAIDSHHNDNIIIDINPYVKSLA